MNHGDSQVTNEIWNQFSNIYENKIPIVKCVCVKCSYNYEVCMKCDCLTGRSKGIFSAEAWFILKEQ